MVNTLILSDEDGDGITSSRIVQMATEAEVVLFQHWNKFGIDDEDISMIKLYKPKNVFILDIGSDADMLQKLADLSEETNCDVAVLDNHPPEDTSYFENFFGQHTRVVSTVHNCTAGIAFDMFKDVIPKEKLKWAEIWAIVGLNSDVKAESKQGGEIIKELTPKHPELFGTVLTPRKTGTTESGWESVESSSIIRQLVQVVNVPKRALYHYGAYLMYNAMVEIEKTGNLLSLWEPIDTYSEDAMKFKTLMPNTWILRQTVDEYYEKAKSVFSSENDFKFWNFDHITVSQIRHAWNLGGYVANLKAPEKKKTHFCVNLGGIDPATYKVTARWANVKDANNIDVGKVFTKASELSNGNMKGGGLLQAGSAVVKRTFPVLDTIRCLVLASQEVASTQ